MNKENIVLSKNVSKLDVSEEFKHMAKLNNFQKLEQIFSFSVDDLWKLPGMTSHVMAELGTFLRKNGLMHMLDG